MKDHVTRQQFLLEFFGPLGRELGSPAQHFTDNPMDIFEHIEKCKREKNPAFISVQPRTAHYKIYGIEKIFYDFDFGKKSNKFTERQIAKHRDKMKKEIKIFLYHLLKTGIKPLIIKTRKGYHVHIYFDQIYQIDNDTDFWRKVYNALHERFTKSNRHKYKYIDTTSDEDIFRLCRIPTSIHEKSGEECIIVDTKLNSTKLRSVEFYKMYGLKRDDLIKSIEWVKKNEKKRKEGKEAIAKLKTEKKESWETEHSFVGKVRPCFQKFMKAGEADHQTRLAMEIEAFYCGYKTREALVEWFRWANDWDGDKSGSECRKQVDWFFKNKVDEFRHGEPKCKVKPYKCNTIRKYGWCIKENCPIYIKQKRKGKIGKT